jgi:hypothetical protein
MPGFGVVIARRRPDDPTNRIAAPGAASGEMMIEDRAGMTRAADSEGLLWP